MQRGLAEKKREFHPPGIAIEIDRRDHILLLTISDPATHNAICGDDLYHAVEDVVQPANADLDIRTIVLTAMVEKRNPIFQGR